MMNFWILISLILFNSFKYPVNSSGIEIPKHHRDDDIIQQMLSIERYNKHLRPDAHTIVNVSIHLLTISSPDESSFTYEIEFLMHQTWNDHRLSYEDGGRHKYLNALMHTNKVWIPEIYFIKAGQITNSYDVIAMKIFSNGNIEFTTRRDMKLLCTANINRFPFDNLNCFFGIESKYISHERYQLELKWATNASIQSSKSLFSTNAYIVENITDYCDQNQSWRTEYSCLSAILFFARDKSFYMSIFFIPSIIIVFLSYTNCWIDISAINARIFITFVSILSFITLSISFRTKLPIVSNLTAINLWDFICTIFLLTSLIKLILEYERTKIKSIIETQLKEDIELTVALNQEPPQPCFKSKRIFPNSLNRAYKIIYPKLFIIFLIIFFVNYMFI